MEQETPARQYPHSARVPSLRPGYKSFLGVVLVAICIPFFAASFLFSGVVRPVDPKPEETRISTETMKLSEQLRLKANVQSRHALLQYQLGADAPSETAIESQVKKGALPALQPTALEALDNRDRRMLLSKVIGNAASLYAAALPIEYNTGALITSVAPEGRRLKFTYRVNPGITDFSELARRLHNDICAQMEADTVLQLGGVYEYSLLAGRNKLFDHFEIDQSSCN